MDKSVILIHPDDNVAVATAPVKPGELVRTGEGLSITAVSEVPANHKIALTDIEKNAPVRKYGEVIGFAKEDIKAGEWVHTHNMKSGGE